MIREIDGGGSSYLSQNSVIAHFGLGNAQKIDRVTVYWTGGNKQTITNVAPNQKIEITELPEKKPKRLLAGFLIGVISIVIVLALVWKRKGRKEVSN